MGITTVRLQPEVEQSLLAMTTILQRSKSWLINQALIEFVGRQEQEKQRWQETLQAMESVAQGRIVSSESVQAWLNSWGSSNELPTPKSSL
jgi:predicted transcriptional regulator